MTALTAAALVVLIGKTIPAAATHEDQIHAVGYDVATCSIMAEHRGEGAIRTLTHIADCARDDHQIRAESGDLTLTMLSLALVGAGGWHLMHHRHH